MRRLFLYFCVFLSLPLQAVPSILKADEMPLILRITTPNRFKNIFSHADTGEREFREFLKKMDVNPKHQQLLEGIPEPLKLAAPCQAVSSLVLKRLRPAYMQGDFSPQQLKEKHYKRSAAIINLKHMLLTVNFFPRNPDNQHPLFNDGFNGYVIGLRRAAWEEINYYRNGHGIDSAEKDHLARLMHLYLYSVIEMRHFDVPATYEEKANAWQMAKLLHEERFTTSKVIYLLKALLIKEGFRPEGVDTEEGAKVAFIEEYNRFLQVDHAEPQQHFLFDLIATNIEQAAHAAQQQAQVESEEAEHETTVVGVEGEEETEEPDIIPILPPDAHRDGVSARLRKDESNDRMNLLREAAANYHAALNAQHPEGMDVEEEGQNPPNSPENPDLGGIQGNDTDSDSDTGSDPDNQGGGAILGEASRLDDEDDHEMQVEQHSADEDVMSSGEDSASSVTIPVASPSISVTGAAAAVESDDDSEDEEIKPSKRRANQRRIALESSDDEADEEERGSPPQAKKVKGRRVLPEGFNDQLIKHGKSSEIGEIIAGILKEMACTDGGIKRVSSAQLKDEVAKKMRANPGKFPINLDVFEKISDTILKTRLQDIIQKYVDGKTKKLYFLSKSQKTEALREARRPLFELIEFRLRLAQKEGKYPTLKEVFRELEKEKNPILLERMQAEKVSKIQQLEKRYEQYISNTDWYKSNRRELDEKYKNLQRIYEHLYLSLEKENDDMRKVSSTDFIRELKSTSEFTAFIVENPGFKSTSEKGITFWYENRRGVIPTEEKEDLNKKIVDEIRKLKKENEKISAAKITKIINEKFGIKKTKIAIEKIIFRSGLSKKETVPRASGQLTDALADIVEELRSKNNGTIPSTEEIRKQVKNTLSSMPTAVNNEWLELTENGKNKKRAYTILISAKRKLLRKDASASSS